MTITLIILAVSALLFVSGRIRSDLVAICAALSLVLTGVLTPEEALSGFSNPIVVMMAGLFIVGGGIFSTGLAKKTGSYIVGLAGNSEKKLLVLVMLATTAVGAFVSNTGTVALMLPIVVSMARGAGISSSRMLMPLAFAGSMGGMLTLIGTPPNLIINDALTNAGYTPLSFFSFTPVGIICIIVGIIVLVPLTARFLKGRNEQTAQRKNKSLDDLAQEYQITDNLAGFRVEKESPAIGKTVKQLNVHGLYRLTVIEIRRTSSNSKLLQKIEQYAVSDMPLMEGDVIYARGPEEGAQRFLQEMQLSSVALNKKDKSLRFYNVGMAEILLMQSSNLVNTTVGENGFREKYGVNVLGIRRREQYFRHGLKDVRLHAGDIILVQGEWKAISGLAQESDWVVLGQPLEQAAHVTLDHKAPLAALIMLAMVIVMAVDSIPVEPVTAVVAAAVLMIFSGCLRNVEAAYKNINWESLVLFGAMLPMATALEKTGTSGLISSTLVDAVGGLGPYALLAAIYLTTSLLTFFISNTVTAMLMAPIAMAAAAGQGISPVPLLMGVTVAASMCFASPFSTPPNALVMSAGGYQPVDYIKVGLPLQIAIAVVMIVALPLLFPF